VRSVPVNRRELLLAALGQPVIAIPSHAQQETPRDRAPSSDAIRSLLALRVDAGRESLGYVALVRDDAGPRLVTCGAAGRQRSRPFDGDTVFEIGSITKVFTALLLADAVARGSVKRTDPVEKYLPAEGRPNSFDNKPISLLDLVT
jgi:serine-type D-Ala-D-Ala carboxypeptidase/endopeptidase